MPPRVWPPKVYSHVSGRSRVRIEGVDHWLGVEGSAEAGRRYKEIVTQYERLGRVGKREDLTVSELVRWWNGFGPTCLPPGSKEMVQYGQVLVLLSGQFDSEPADQFSPLKLKRFRELLVERQWSVRTINRQITRVKTVFKRAAEEELLPASVSAALREVRCLPPWHETPANVEARANRVRPADEESFNKLLPELSPVVRAMLELQALSGMRSGEVRVIRTIDIDRAGEVWLYRPKQHKNLWRGKTRVVALGEQARGVLLPFIREDHPEAFLFDPRRAPKASRATYPFYRADTYCQAVKRACKRAGVKLTPYQLRHLFRLRAGRACGDEATRAAMGHETISTTQLYGGIDQQLAEDVARKIG